MRKVIIAAFAAVALMILGVFGAGAAFAGTTTPRSCPSGGTTTTVWFNHSVVGGIEQGNYFSWGTSPTAQLNRISISVRHNSSGNEALLGAAGGTSSTLNDVSSADAYYQPGNWPASVGTSGSIEWRASVWGGVGNSEDSCNTGWHLAD